jgi:hypothetical protein
VPPFGVVPHQLFLLAVNRDDRLAGLEVSLRLVVDVVELGIAIGVLGTLVLLRGSLE